MTASVVSVEETATLAEIARLVERHRIKRVPVLRDGKLVGIVTRGNLLQGLATLKAEPPSTSMTQPFGSSLSLNSRTSHGLICTLMTSWWRTAWFICTGPSGPRMSDGRFGSQLRTCQGFRA